MNVPTERTEAKARKRAPVVAITLPDWIDPGLWGEWLEVRKAKRSPNTESAQLYNVDRLAKMRATGQDANAVIRQSIERGWTGLFTVKEETHGRNAPESLVERVARKRQHLDQLDLERGFSGR